MALSFSITKLKLTIFLFLVAVFHYTANGRALIIEEITEPGSVEIPHDGNQTDTSAPSKPQPITSGGELHSRSEKPPTSTEDENLAPKNGADKGSEFLDEKLSAEKAPTDDENVPNSGICLETDASNPANWAKKGSAEEEIDAINKSSEEKKHHIDDKEAPLNTKPDSAKQTDKDATANKKADGIEESKGKIDDGKKKENDTPNGLKGFIWRLFGFTQSTPAKNTETTKADEKKKMETDEKKPTADVGDKDKVEKLEKELELIDEEPSVTEKKGDSVKASIVNGEGSKVDDGNGKSKEKSNGASKTDPGAIIASGANGDKKPTATDKGKEEEESHGLKHVFVRILSYIYPPPPDTTPTKDDVEKNASDDKKTITDKKRDTHIKKEDEIKKPSTESKKVASDEEKQDKPIHQLNSRDAAVLDEEDRRAEEEMEEERREREEWHRKMERQESERQRHRWEREQRDTDADKKSVMAHSREEPSHELDVGHHHTVGGDSRSEERAPRLSGERRHLGDASHESSEAPAKVKSYHSFSHEAKSDENEHNKKDASAHSKDHEDEPKPHHSFFANFGTIKTIALITAGPLIATAMIILLSRNRGIFPRKRNCGGGGGNVVA